MSLSAILFLSPLLNSLVSSFIHNDRKWASGAMAEGAGGSDGGSGGGKNDGV